MRWSLRQASIEFGASRETIIRGLRTNGVRTDVQTDYSTREIFDALAGDLKLTRAKLARAELSKLERENAVAEGRLHTLENVQQIVWDECLAPLRRAMLSMPTELAPLCVDPASAQAAIQKFSDEIMARILSGLPTEKPTVKS